MNTFAVFPLGLVQKVKLIIDASYKGEMVSEAVVVPDWAQSFSVYQQGLNVDAATGIVITVAPPYPEAGTFVSMDENPLETGKGEIASAVTRHRPCSPRERLRGELDTFPASGNDLFCDLVFVFSPFPAVNA